MIWMGVVGPEDWNALGNRFPVHYQWEMNRGSVASWLLVTSAPIAAVSDSRSGQAKWDFRSREAA